MNQSMDLSWQRDMYPPQTNPNIFLLISHHIEKYRDTNKVASVVVPSKFQQHTSIHMEGTWWWGNAEWGIVAPNLIPGSTSDMIKDNMYLSLNSSKMPATVCLHK